jgi:hypothetical protein
MKVCQLFLLLFILYLTPCLSEIKSNSGDFEAIVSFLQTHSETQAKQSYDLYAQRVTKMRRKKEIIIRKVYEISPIVGEILALANVEKIDLILNRFFIMRESDLLRKHIIMWDANSDYVSNSAKVLLNLLLCNNKFNKLRCILNLLMEGLCMGDDRSIRIFKEIVVTVIVDTILKTKFLYFKDLKAKFNLIRIFNKPLHFTPVTKLKFVEKMMLSDKLKEMLTFIIMRLKNNEAIEVEMDLKLHENPKVFANNTRLFDFSPNQENQLTKKSPEEKQEELQEEIEKSLTFTGKENLPAIKTTLSRAEARKILDNIKSYSTASDMRFKETNLINGQEMEYSEVNFIDPQHLDISKSQKLKLSEIKEQLKNEYTDFLYNQTTSSMPQIEEVLPHYQVGLNQRSIFPKYRKHLSNLIRLNELLDEFPPGSPKGSVDVSTPVKKVIQTKTTITKEVAPGINVSMQFKQKDKSKFRFKAQNKITNAAQLTTKDLNFAEKSFEQLTGLQSPNNYNKPDFLNANNYNDQTKQMIIDKSQNSQEIKDLVSDKNIKVVFPKEIHSTYQVEKKGMKTVEINKNSKYFLT